MLFPEGVLVDLPVLSAIEPEAVGHERLGLLPHLVGFLRDELVFGRVVGVWFIRFAIADPVRERNLTCTRGPHNRASTLLYGIAEFLAEAFVPSPPECRLIREALKAEILTKRGIHP